MSSHRTTRSLSRRAVCGLALFAVGGLSACGFTPIAAPVSKSAGGPGENIDPILLNQTRISGDDDRFSYELRRALGLRVVLDPQSTVRLIAETSIVEQGLAIEQNDTVTRLNLTATTRYQLVPAVGDPISAGTIRTVTAVNATTELFATQVSREDAVKRLAEETSRRLLAVLQVENAKPNAPI